MLHRLQPAEPGAGLPDLGVEFAVLAELGGGGVPNRPVVEADDEAPPNVLLLPLLLMRTLLLRFTFFPLPPPMRDAAPATKSAMSPLYVSESDCSDSRSVR